MMLFEKDVWHGTGVVLELCYATNPFNQKACDIKWQNLCWRDLWTRRCIHFLKMDAKEMKNQRRTRKLHLLASQTGLWTLPRWTEESWYSEVFRMNESWKTVLSVYYCPHKFFTLTYLYGAIFIFKVNVIVFFFVFRYLKWAKYDNKNWIVVSFMMQVRNVILTLLLLDLEFRIVKTRHQNNHIWCNLNG